MSALIDITGQRFGRLVAMSYERRGGLTMWNVQCDCGKLSVVCSRSLRTGATRSCGCLNKEFARSRNRSNGYGHPHKGLRIHKVWQTMHYRCKSPDNNSYDRYGGRGIKVCDRWNDYDSFLIDMGDPGKGFEIDRIDNSNGYCPENCRWVTRTQNNRNRTNSKSFEFQGVITSLKEISQRTGIPYSSLWARIKAGWNLNTAFSTPARFIARKGEARPHIRKRQKLIPAN